MTGDVENLSVRAQRTRRNVLKMGAILAPVALARITQRSCGRRLCARSRLQLFPEGDEDSDG